MNEIRKLHERAMELAQMAFVARLKGDSERASKLSLEAYENEVRAARLVPDELSSEPTRSVLYRSAASLALDCNELREAERLIAAGLAGYPPEEIAEELRDLLEEVNFRRHLDLRGISLESDEVQMSLAGNAISAGTILTREFITRIEDVQSLVYRTVERKMNRPFRKRGPLTREVRHYETFVSVPRAASFAVSLRVSRPKQLLLPFEELDSTYIIDEILTCLEVFNSSKESELQRKIPDPFYYGNFVTTAGDVAPDGDKVNLVGFTTICDGRERRVDLTRTRDEIGLIAPDQIDEDLGTKGEIRAITGILRRADAISVKEVRLVDEEGPRTHKVIVREGALDDIVKHLWNETVTMEVLTIRGENHFRRLL